MEFTRKTERYAQVMRDYQEKIAQLSEDLTLAKMDNAALRDDIRALEAGRDEQDGTYQGMLLEHQEMIQQLLEENKRLNEIIAKHDAECLPSL